jgi:hypothetical protein
MEAAFQRTGRSLKGMTPKRLIPSLRAFATRLTAALITVATKASAQSLQSGSIGGMPYFVLPASDVVGPGEAISTKSGAEVKALGPPWNGLRSHDCQPHRRDCCARSAW